MKTIRQINFSEILPRSLTDDAQLNAVAKSLDNILKTISDETRLILLYSRIDELNHALLDILAYQLHCDWYDAINFSLTEKRAAIKKSVEVHRLKGTIYATEKTAQEFLENAEVVELGNFRFALTCTNYIGELNSFRNHMLRLYDAKNVRSWLDYIELKIEEPKINLYAGTTEIITGVLHLNFDKLDDENINLYVGNVEIITGNIDLTFDDTIPDEEINIYAASYIYFTGEINLACELEIPKFIIETPVADLGFANVMIARGGNPYFWETLDFDTLKLYFDFAISRHQNQRAISLKNPRQDVTAEEVRAFSDYVAQNKIIRNELGEFSTGISKYAIKTHSTRTIQMI